MADPRKLWVYPVIGLRGGKRDRFTFEGVKFRLVFTWAAYTSIWVLTLQDGDGVALKSGLTLRHGVDVLAPFSGAAMPGAGRGKLGAWDTTGQQQDPGRRDLVRGAAVRMVYIEGA